jgi:SAM-dependent methyltransferase
MSTTSAFVGSIPETYHSALGPLLFEPYARELAARVSLGPRERVLELACGTGIVTRALLSVLPPTGTLVATDLNEAMLDVARGHVGSDARLRFQQADACALPFEGGSFDLLVCQFSVMFFPDKVQAMREARRVLAPGGRYLLDVWDSLEHNPHPGAVHEAVAALFPADPPTFLSTPYGWFDRATIERTLRAGGFDEIRMEVVTLPSLAPTSDDVARGFLEGTPMLGQLRERGVGDVAPIRRAVSEALARRYGQRPCQSSMRAFVISAG